MVLAGARTRVFLHVCFSACVPVCLCACSCVHPALMYLGEQCPHVGVPQHALHPDAPRFSRLQGDYTVSSKGTPTMLNSLMYKLSYWDFGNIMTEANKPTGYDRVRNYEIGNKNYKLDHLHEVGTSPVWGAHPACTYASNGDPGATGIIIIIHCVSFSARASWH